MSKSKWIDARKELPPVNDVFGESDYLLCVSGGQQVVGWYNSRDGAWRCAHHSCTGIPIDVTHWQTLPSVPHD